MDSTNNKLMPKGSVDAVAPTLEAAYPHPFRDYVSVDSHDYLLENFWRILQKRRWTIILSTFAIFTLALIASFRAERLYEAACRVTINKESSDNLGLKDMMSDDGYWDYQVEIETQTKILQSDALALQVIRQLQLENNPLFTGPQSGPKQHEPESGEMDNAQQLQLIRSFQSGVRVTTIPRTRIVEIRYISRDPKLSASIANALANAFIEQNVRTKFETTMQTSDWISSQLSDLKMKVETSQEKLVRYQREHGIIGIDEKQNIITSKLDELNKQLTGAEADRIQKESDYRLAKDGSADLLLRADNNSVLAKLRMDRGTLLTKYAQLNSTFGPAYPKVIETKNQLDDVDRQIKGETQKIQDHIRSDYLTALQREKMLRAAFDVQKIEANKLNESGIEYGILKRDLDTSRQLYDGLLQRLKEASVTAGLRSNNIRIIDSARPPLAPSSPNIPRNLALGLLLGFAAGVVLAFGQEAMDNTVRTPDQSQTISFLPSLAVIPLETTAIGKRKLLSFKTDDAASALALSRSSAASSFFVKNKPFSEIAESYRALRTSVLLSSMGGPPKVILVTSALPQEGKSTTCINCAAVLAQQGSRVLLIDADMRRPKIQSALGIEPALGLSNLLTGSATIEDVVTPVLDIPNLFAIVSGPIPPQPAELLGSELMDKYLDLLRGQFDHIIIDSPPALSVTDSVILSAKVDSVVIVVLAGRTRKEALRRVAQLFTQVNAKVMGTVMNGVDLSSPDHYYYKYGKRYNTNYYRDSEVIESE